MKNTLLRFLFSFVPPTGAGSPSDRHRPAKFFLPVYKALGFHGGDLHPPTLLRPPLAPKRRYRQGNEFLPPGFFFKRASPGNCHRVQRPPPLLHPPCQRRWPRFAASSSFATIAIDPCAGFFPFVSRSSTPPTASPSLFSTWLRMLNFLRGGQEEPEPRKAFLFCVPHSFWSLFPFCGPGSAFLQTLFGTSE